MIACLGTKEVNKLNCLSYSIPLFPDPSRDHWPVTNSWWGQRSKQRANIDDWFVVTSFQFWFCKCWHWRPACLLVHMPRDCAGLCWPVFSNPLDDEVQVLSPPPSLPRWFTDRDRLWGTEERPTLRPLSDSLTRHIIDSGDWQLAWMSHVAHEWPVWLPALIYLLPLSPSSENFLYFVGKFEKLKMCSLFEL